MTKAPPKLIGFDAARYLNDDEAIAEYMTAVLETNNPDLLLLALSDIARTGREVHRASSLSAVFGQGS